MEKHFVKSVGTLLIMMILAMHPPRHQCLT